MISNLIDYLNRSGMKGTKYDSSKRSSSFNRSRLFETAETPLSGFFPL
jgi:hypothetical protein